LVEPGVTLGSGRSPARAEQVIAIDAKVISKKFTLRPVCDCMHIVLLIANCICLESG